MAQPDADAARTDTWALPAWEEYSEAAGSSFAGNWSDVEADVSLDTASSVASTEHQRVYRIQRARGGLPEDKQRDLRELHSLYTRRRLEESSQGAASVRSSVNWFQPAPCVSPRVQEQKPPTPVAKGNQVERELLAQQSEISAELQAVRRQLSDFQDKWKKTEEGKTQVEGETESSTAPTVASSWSSPVSANKGKKVVRDTVAIQTEIEEGEAAVKHWIRLLTEKLEELARKYSHEPTLNFQAAMTHLTALRSSSNAGGELSKENLESTSNSKGEQAVNSVPSLSSWHVGGAFKNAVPLDVAEQFLALEHAIARISIAVEQHERRQMTNFDQAVQQVQGYHHERMQQVVDESITELKMVRGRYKKKEFQLEDELRAATKEVEQLKQTAAEAEHRKKLDRETMEFHLSSAKEQVN
ncbi:unnamed protein product [Phytophthora lilii]|uniref:Unnamed protein product n=1 Tax=Phytophthora lilii TaxID=2077276 RepID=A0A9W6XHJ0_9STRA|nr:unnamed protein product [Phytophthora lilii]